MARRKSRKRKAAPMFHRVRSRKVGRRTRSRRRRSGLSELMTPAGAMAAVRGIGGGAAGGFAAGIAHDMVKNQQPILRVGLELVGSALAYTLVGPNIGAGAAGGFAALESAGLRSQFMSESSPYADPDAINELPPVLNENGEQMTLMESDGQQFYLDEQTGDTYLAEEVYPQLSAY